jgi:hypothetical protein
MGKARTIVVTALAGAVAATGIALVRTADAATGPVVDVSTRVSTVTLGPPNSNSERAGVIEFTVSNPSAVELFNVRVNFNLSAGLTLDAAGGDNCLDGNRCLVSPPGPGDTRTYRFTVHRPSSMDGTPIPPQSLAVVGFSNPGEQVTDPNGLNNVGIFTVVIG